MTHHNDYSSGLISTKDKDESRNYSFTLLRLLRNWNNLETTDDEFYILDTDFFIVDGLSKSCYNPNIFTSSCHWYLAVVERGLRSVRGFPERTQSSRISRMHGAFLADTDQHRPLSFITYLACTGGVDKSSLRSPLVSSALDEPVSSRTEEISR